MDAPEVMKSGSCSATIVDGGTTLPFVISTGAYPDFLLRAARQLPRVRHSLKRAACRSSKPRVSTGNPGERSGGTCGFFPARSHPLQAVKFTVIVHDMISKAVELISQTERFNLRFGFDRESPPCSPGRGTRCRAYKTEQWRLLLHALQSRR